MNRKHASLASIAVLLTAAGILSAGPLNPPAGPVTPSYKTMTEVEPRTVINAANTPGNATNACIISQPGSYYLTSDFIVPAGKNGISITCIGVTLDLNGFTVRGNGATSLKGISGDNTWNDVTIKNGAVEYCTDGIDMATYWNTHIQNVSLSWNTGAGIKFHDGLVENCQSMKNGQGFVVGGGWGIFVHCTATLNNGIGYSSNGGTVFESCSADTNQGQGFYIGSDSTIRNCISAGNTGQGIVCLSNCTLTGNQSRSNGNGSLAGIWLQGNETVAQDNDATNSGYGIYVGGTANTIVRNRSGSNSSNYYIIAGNHVGLITAATTNATLINGNSGGGLGTTDPNANFVY